LTPEEIIAEIEQYEKRISGILSRFKGHDLRSMAMSDPDTDIYPQLMLEIMDLFSDALDQNAYTTNIMQLRKSLMGTSLGGVKAVLAIIRAAHTRLTRNPEILRKKQAEENTRRKENVFIIHGRDEGKWRELKDIIKNVFRLNPIILSEQPDIGKTVIEKFEHYAGGSSRCPRFINI
jgi:DNA polymerase III delta subunit